MKKRIASLLLALTLLCSVFSLSSCYLMQLNSSSGSQSNTNSENKNNGGSTINLNGGDSYNVSINSSASSDVLAASKALLSSVSVYCTFERVQSGGYYGTGSTTTASSAGAGVIYKIDKTTGDAYVITNYHVVYDAYAKTTNHISDDINIYLYGMESADYAIPATYVGGSMHYDLAILKVSGSSVLMESSAMAVSFADSNKIAVLETAIAIGNPERKGISATVGHINVDSEYITLNMSDSYTSTTVQLRVMRIDAAVNSGNSGGGLFNSKGELIGIVNAKLSSDSVDSIGYAIPSNVVLAVANNVIDYCEGTDKECVYRCILGINVTAVKQSAEYDKETGKIIKKESVAVSDITESSAVREILEIGDIINSITIDGEKHEVFRIYHVIDVMLNARVGDRVVFNITHGGETKDVSIEITSSMLVAYK